MQPLLPIVLLFLPSFCLAAVGDLVGQTKITYMTKYATETEIQGIKDNHEVYSHAVTADAAWADCAAMCSNMNYMGDAKCRFFYTPTSVSADALDECLISDVAMAGIAFTDKDDANGRAVRVLKSIEGIPVA